MNVSDALLLPSFEGATVIAGRAGLDREVSTAMIVEAPDIESWGKSGQMLITSFYAFENLSADGLTFFFDKADELGIGAIDFKPERLLAEGPLRSSSFATSTIFRSFRFPPTPSTRVCCSTYLATS